MFLPSSKMYHHVINSPETGLTQITVTTQLMANDINGNARFKTQVWRIRVDKDNNVTGNLWSPTIKGYRRTKDDSYILKGSELDDNVYAFIKAFVKAVQHNG